MQLVEYSVPVSMYENLKPSRVAVRVIAPEAIYDL